MVLDRGSGLVGELALRQAETSSRSAVAETRLPAERTRTALEAERRHERQRGNTLAKVESEDVTSGYSGNRAGIARRIPGGGKAEEGSDIGQG
jgi:hypothetical protein